MAQSQRPPRRGLVDRRDEALAILQRNGGQESSANAAPVETQEWPEDRATADVLAYDPITGPQKISEDIDTSGYGQRRDPQVPVDPGARPRLTDPDNDATLNDGSDDTFFERPLAPGTQQAGDWDDPNDRPQRID